MSFKSSKAEDVYSKLKFELEKISAELSSNSGDEQFKAAQVKALKVIQQHQTELETEIKDLIDNSEWSKFTMAFYGETNAGKSTLIESLRIYFNEKTKQQTRKCFIDKINELLNLKSKIKSLEESAAIEIEKLNVNQTEKNIKLDEVNSIKNNELLIFEKINTFINNKKKSASLFERIKYFFFGIPERKELEKQHQKIIELDKNITELTEKFDSLITPIQISSDTIKSEISTLKNKFNQQKESVSGFADGAIIGDGRSDFTRNTTQYDFEKDGVRFSILDVPGIEGDEKEVNTPIKNALAKAHAVFYITRKATPPQKGDDNCTGTLEKIKKDLGPQAEVWAIYNKSITNPIALEKNKLISDEEEKSLQDMESIICNQLGKDHFQKTITLAAQPAFLSMADCLINGTSLHASREKFLGKFEKNELLKKSNFSSFIKIITNEIIKDSQNKIERSTLNKAHYLTENLIKQLQSNLDNFFQPLSQTINSNATSACSQIDIEFKKLSSNLISSVEHVIENTFSNKTQSEIYSIIESDVSNSEFKDHLNRVIGKNQEELKNKLPLNCDSVINEFQNAVEKIIKLHNQKAEELQSTYQNLQLSGAKSKLNININIDSGFKFTHVLAAIMGGAAMIWNPAGWVIIAAGAVAVVLNLAKAIMSFFSSDYKKSQQRKSADENIYNATDLMQSSIISEIKNVLPSIQAKVELAKKSINKPAIQSKHIIDFMQKSINSITDIENDIASAILDSKNKSIANLSRQNNILSEENLIA